MKVNDDHAPTTHWFQGAAVGSDGVIHVAWIDRRHNRKLGPNEYSGGGDHSRGIEPAASLYYSRSLDGGRTFEKNRYVAGRVCACCRLAVGLSKGNVMIAWRSEEPGDVRDIFTALSTDNGSSWSQPRLAHRDNWVIEGCPHVGPAIASTQSELYLAWLTAASGKPEVRMVISRDNGRTFGERIILSDGVTGANHPRLVARGDRVGVVFEGQLEKAQPASVVYREVGQDGTVLPLTGRRAGQGSASYPALAHYDRGVLIAWSEVKDEKSMVYLGRRR
jgi:hypothetical protein